MSSGFTVVIDKKAEKRLDKITTPKHRNQILVRIAELAHTPRPQDSIQLNPPEEGFRLNVGDYRVLYDIDYDHCEVWVYRVMNRSEGYRQR